MEKAFTLFFVLPRNLSIYLYNNNTTLFLETKSKSLQSLQPSLKPPFSLTIPNPDEYIQLNHPIDLHAILT